MNKSKFTQFKSKKDSVTVDNYQNMIKQIKEKMLVPWCQKPLGIIIYTQHNSDKRLLSR